MGSLDGLEAFYLGVYIILTRKGSYEGGREGKRETERERSKLKIYSLSLLINWMLN